MTIIKSTGFKLGESIVKATAEVTNGRIRYQDIGYQEPLIFYWMSASDGEISGFVEHIEGGIVPGTSGWYRTTDPQKAAISALQKALAHRIENS